MVGLTVIGAIIMLIGIGYVCRDMVKELNNG